MAITARHSSLWSFSSNFRPGHPVIALLASFLVLAACCVGDPPPEQSRMDQEWKAAVREELGGRSYRQFQPARDGDPRKSVILDFSDGIRLRAQYAPDDHALNE